MLWYPGLVLYPAAFNHWLALTAIIFCSYALTREHPGLDVPVVLVLGFALCSSGVGVAGAIGCIAYLGLSHCSLRRWFAVLVPTAAWLTWWLLVAHQARRSSSGSHSVSDSAGYVAGGLLRSFEGQVAGNRLLGIGVAALFVANLAWRLREGPRAAAHELAWSVALVLGSGSRTTGVCSRTRMCSATGSSVRPSSSWRSFLPPGRYRSRDC